MLYIKQFFPIRNGYTSIYAIVGTNAFALIAVFNGLTIKRRQSDQLNASKVPFSSEFPLVDFVCLKIRGCLCEWIFAQNVVPCLVIKTVASCNQANVILLCNKCGYKNKEQRANGKLQLKTIKHSPEQMVATINKENSLVQNQQSMLNAHDAATARLMFGKYRQEGRMNFRHSS